MTLSLARAADEWHTTDILVSLVTGSSVVSTITVSEIFDF